MTVGLWPAGDDGPGAAAGVGSSRFTRQQLSATIRGKQAAPTTRGKQLALPQRNVILACPVRWVVIPGEGRSPEGRVSSSLRRNKAGSPSLASLAGDDG